MLHDTVPILLYSLGSAAAGIAVLMQWRDLRDKE